MGDRDHRLARHQFVQAVLDRRLHFRIQRRGGLVQDQDRRVLEQHAGDGDALALAAGQLHAALADLRVVAALALAVLQLLDELVGARLGHGGAQLRLAGIWAAVQQVVADRAVQQRGVLGDQADLLTQALLGDAGDVLPVDQDAALLQVVQPQQHVDQGRLAGAGRPDQADLLARAHLQVEPGDDPAALAVMEVDVLEADLAALHAQRHRVGAILHLCRLRDGLHAVLHRTDVLEDAVDRPHDPAGHVVDADHQAGGQGDRAHADLSAAPQPQRQPAGHRDQEAVDDGDGAVHRGGHAGLPAVLDRQLVDRLAHVGLLAPGMREQLERGDVGIAVDDAAHRLGACVRGDPGALLHPRHEVDHQRDVGQHPHQQRRHQPGIGLGEQVQRATGVDHDVPERIDHLHRRLAQRGAGLHDPVGDAPGEVVLEEAQALPHHVVVHQPARAVAQAGHDGLVHQQVVQGHEQRPRQQHDERHPQQLAGMALEEARPRLLGDHVDDAAEEVEHRHLHQRQRETGQQRGQQERPQRTQVMQIEAHHPARRHLRLDLREDLDQGLEPAEHRHVTPEKGRQGSVFGVTLRDAGNGEWRMGNRKSGRPCASLSLAGAASVATR
ncbi:hypothetical protein NB689_002064 [Xanthomonas sacchari]|nr:hypothetical protein [Xanthomonas sacchari]